MAKSSSAKKYTIHKRLEQPVHSFVGYGALLLLALMTFVFIYFLKQMYLSFKVK
jgi:hypothetical protein